MAKQKYAVGETVELVDGGGATWWFKIIDETEEYYILDAHPNDPEGAIGSDLYTKSTRGKEGLIAFKKKGFNAEKISEEDIADILEDLKEYEELEEN